MLEFLGNMKKRQLLRSLFPDPLPEGHPVDRDSFFCPIQLQQSHVSDDLSQERKFSPKRKFWAGYPCGHPAKNFGQAIQILEKTSTLAWTSRARTSMKKLRPEKFRADFSFPTKCSKSRDLVQLRFAIQIANRKSLAI